MNRKSYAREDSSLDSYRVFGSSVKKVMRRIFLILTIAALTNHWVALAQFDPALAENLQVALDNSIQANNIIGASAAVIMPNQGTWLGVSGYSVPASSEPVRSDMLFGIGSITKTYTAAMILELAEDGVLSLDDSLYQWIPSFRFVDSTITIRQLLQHRSGIYNYTDFPGVFDDIFPDPPRVWSPEEILTSLLNPPYFSPGPGGNWHYSNTNYIIAGMIIKEATGADISTELHTRFLDPHNLNHTFLEVEDTPSGEVVHHWFDLNNDGTLDDLYSLPRTTLYSLAWSAGAILATAEDVAKWAGLLYGGAFLSQPYMDHMLRSFRFPDRSGYGLGTRLVLYREKTFWGHDGSIPGFTSWLLYLPEEDASFVVLLNQDGNVGSVIAALLDAYLDYVPTGVAVSEPPLPGDFALHQNYPNPFNPETVIIYQLPVTSDVQLTIYDALGQEIRTLVNGRQSTGSKSVVWDGKNDLGQPVSSGMFFYRLKAGDRVQTNKMVLMR